MKLTEYRAKAINTGLWVYSITISKGLIKRKAQNVFFEFAEKWVCVEGETVGRKTPFTDKNEKPIYEGDILGDWTEVDGNMHQSRYAVFFCETTGQWMLDQSVNQDRSYSVSLFAELNDFEYEVLGTIHDKK